MVEITPEVQAQLNEAKKNCPFCKIISGETEGAEVYSDDLVHAVLDINPWVRGHTLMMPKEHYPIMPYLPAETFKHLFGKMAEFVKAVKKAFLCSGANVLIANGAVAGQQSPHFLVHIIPRDEEDGFDKYSLDEEKAIDTTKLEEANKIISQNLPIMMNNHFGRNPADWRKLQFNGGVYEDEKVIVNFAEIPQCVGHMKVSVKDFVDLEDMDEESAAHLFFVASFCATAVFEGLGAQGTNIILKTGNSGDNSGLSVHVLPRYQDDGLDLVGKAMEPKPDNKAIAEKIKSETFFLNYKEEKRVVIDRDKKEEVKILSSVEKEIEAAIAAAKR
jgi:histidine triad (HIT) family protein